MNVGRADATAGLEAGKTPTQHDFSVHRRDTSPALGDMGQNMYNDEATRQQPLFGIRGTDQEPGSIQKAIVTHLV